MALQYSTPVNNARLDAVESSVGASAKMRIYSGSPPVNCAAAATGTLLVEVPLPADWMNAASANSKTKLGTWSAAAVAGGVAGYFRITDNAGTVTGIQGTAGSSGTDATLDNTNIALNQVVTVNTFTLTANNT